VVWALVAKLPKTNVRIMMLLYILYLICITW
jgi:hypothetical protein